MGPGAMNAAAAAWINTNAWSDRTFTDNTVAANLRGTLFDGWAGPILVAVGAEYRTNASKGNNDPNSKLGLFSQQAWTFLPATTQKVTEVYGELNVPLFTGSPLGKAPGVEGAVRQTHQERKTAMEGKRVAVRVGRG